MSIKADKWIRRMAEGHRMIEPFEAGQVREVNGHRIVSYGTSSYGYDVRCSDEFKIFTNINSTIVDPKAFDAGSFVDFKGSVCIIPPNSFALARTVEYFRIPRNVLVACLGKSTYARCFRGDTRVALVDGTSPTLEDMARRADAGELFWGYSVGAYGRICVSLLDAPRYVGRDSLLEIELDNGEVIAATPDHDFMQRDGRMQPAAALRPGHSLMPLYRELIRGYESVYQPLNGHLYPTHRLADEWNLRGALYSDVPGTHRHHIDFDRRNNRPTNIERMASSEPIRLHNNESYGDTTRERHPADATRERHRDAMVRRYSDPSERIRQGALSAAAWARDDGTRRRQQAEVARAIRIREEIDAEAVHWALHQTGSIRGAARMLNCDRSAFRRFPTVIAQFAGRSAPRRNHKVVAVRETPGDHDVYCLTVPEAGNFAVEAGIFVSNCGIIVNVTPLEPEWEGHVTLEFSNTTPLPAKIYANEGVAQVLFFESDEVCETSYKDRGGKYQGQQGVTLPKM
jgi:dCTP deaminase